MFLQIVYFMTYDNYNAQKAEYNRTIQYTVAASKDGVTPDRVTDIDVQLAHVSARQQQGQGHVRGHAGTSANDVCALRYTVKVYDPLVPYDTLRAQIIDAASTGRMDVSLHHYAAMFNASNLNNGTFSLPQVASGDPVRASSSQLTGAEIAGLVIGIIMFVAMVATLVLFVMRNRKRNEQPEEDSV